MHYTARNPGLQLQIRDEVADYSVPGQKRVVKPALWVEFGQFGSAFNPGEVTADGTVIASRHDFGNTVEFADFRGGYIDLEAMIDQKIREKLWTPEDGELVRTEMEQICDDSRHPHHGLISRHVPQAPTAPWPTYDDMHPSGIAEQAQLLGLLPAAIVYERATANREDLVAQMEDLARQADALTAA
jgi:hypothetical protein